MMDEMVPAFTGDAREPRLPPDRVHLRLRPPVLERHVHRALQRGQLHGLAKRHRPVPDLRLAPPDAPDPAVGRRPPSASWSRRRRTSRLARPGVRHLSRRPGGHHPPRPAAGRRLAGRPDGHPALDALRPRRPRDPGAVPEHGPRAADGCGHRRAGLGRSCPTDQIADVRYQRPGRRPDRRGHRPLRRLGLEVSPAFRTASRPTSPPATPTGAAATTTASRTPASTWPSTGPWWPATRPASTCPPRSEPRSGRPGPPPRRWDGAGRRPGPSAPACSPRGARRCRASWARRDRWAR